LLGQKTRSENEFEDYFEAMALPLSVAIGLLFGFALSSCGRDEVISRYPEGQEKEILTYSWFGPKDSLHLKQRRTFTFDGKLEADLHYQNGRLSGEASFYWSNGQLMERGEYRDGLREGPWIFHHNQFVRSAQGSYSKGKPHGPWESYYEDGALRAKGSLHKGDTVGQWIHFGLRGDTILISNCNASQPLGSYSSRHENGAEFETYHCLYGKKFGAFSRKSERGSLEESGFFDSLGRKDSLRQTFHSGEKLASSQSYSAGLWSGETLAWDDSGRVKEKGKFVAGTGYRERFHPSGKLAERDSFFQGKREGASLSFFKNGKTQRRLDYRSDLPDSLQQWHENGRLALQGGYKNGKRNGIWEEWYPDGKLKEISPYDTGVYHGERKFFDSTGKLFRTQQYYRGLPTVGTLPGFKTSKRKP
jgi:antitoxin component YwqK of YwqJK toxin-antitoxin module